MEFQPVLDGCIIVGTAHYKAVLLSQLSLEGKRGFAFVVDMLDAVAHDTDKTGSNRLAAEMNAHAMSLHHGRQSIAVDDQSRQVVTLAMHQSVGIVLRVICNTQGQAHLKGRLQTRFPEIIVNLDIPKRKYTYRNGTYLIVSDSNKIALF